MNFNKIIIATFALLFAVAFTACSEKGPAEKAGEEIDNAVENAGDAIENATDEAGDTLEQAGDKIEDKTD